MKLNKGIKMIYTWKCLNCGKTIEVEQPEAKKDVGPMNCADCKHTSFERIIGKTAFIGKKQKGRYNSHG